MKTATTEHRGIWWRSFSRIEDLDFANDIYLLSYSYEGMAVKLKHLEKEAHYANQCKHDQINEAKHIQLNTFQNQQQHNRGYS